MMTEFLIEIKEIKTWLPYSQVLAVSYQFIIMDWFNIDGIDHRSGHYQTKQEAEEAAREFYWSL